MLDSDSSLRLNLLRFPLIVGIVFIHAFGSTVRLAGGEVGVSHNASVAAFVQNLISQGVARIAVPVFFLMSGYLFFVNLEWSRQAYSAKLMRRTRTLLVPYLFWNVATLSVTALAQAMPAGKAFFSGKTPPIAGFGAYDYMNALLGLDGTPIAYQFWFIRDLMILVVLAPIGHLVNKTVPVTVYVLLFVCWFVNRWPVVAPACEATAFFYFGGYLAERGKSLFGWDRRGPIFLAVYLVIVLLDAASYGGSFNAYVHKVGIVLGVLSALYVTKHIARMEGLKAYVLGLGSASFFVYAAHEPLLTIIRKIAYRTLAPESSAVVLGLYFAIPIVVIAFLVLLYRGLARVAPRCVSVVTGGR
ncbi:MAG: acyltransferase [Planctomycetota bacterium]